jgi:hypothetical protein
MATPPKKAPQSAAVTDPLEAAKVATKPVPVVVVVAPPAPPPPAPPDEPPTAQTAKRYRVAHTTTISLHGQMTKLQVGDVISEASYGPAGMRSILGQNVPLVELKD